MKNTYKILIILVSLISINSHSQTRYLEEIFSDITVESDVIYGNNISVLPALAGLPPAPTDLICDIYHPTGDSITNRPVMIIAHTGVFLPAVLNGQATGTKKDSSIVEQCMRWAKKGYVAIAYDYRLGWNPTSTDQNTRSSTLIQASYRAIQDSRSLIRFLRYSTTTGNPYGINSDKIVIGGQGSGGYISLGVATLDTVNELYLNKFFDLSDPQQPIPYVIPSIFGNIWGTDMGYMPVTDSLGNPVIDSLGNPVTAPFSLPNHPGYSSDVAFAWNAGGALADISWLTGLPELDHSGNPTGNIYGTCEIPIVSFHCNLDPYAPIDTGDVIVPTTGDFVVEVMGSRVVQHYANILGNNDVFINAGFSDAFTNAANTNNSGYEGLYVFDTPDPSVNPNAFGELPEEQSAPWDWWDNVTYDAQFAAVNGAPAGYGAANSLLGNPDMSPSKGRTYIDTIQGYLAPRIYIALDLGNSTTSNINDIVRATTRIYPNPSTNYINVVSYAVNINKIKIINLEGKEILDLKVNSNTTLLNTSSLNSGLYLIEIYSDNNLVRKKLVIE